MRKFEEISANLRVFEEKKRYQNGKKENIILFARKFFKFACFLKKKTCYQSVQDSLATNA